MKKLLYPVSLILLCMMLSGWGSKGHKIINQKMAACLPAGMSFLAPDWTNVVTSFASEADYRKSQDVNESPKHYIDIDNYPEFVQTGAISQVYDSVLAEHGLYFVISQGILPWATVTTFDSLKSCFQRLDWNRSALFAADLGHYVGDGHMPLHITKNYNGQLSGQGGVHSRYETSLVGRYEAQIVYPADPAQYIQDVRGYVFSYLYQDYGYVDSVLLADTYATTASGSTSSDAYYQAFWARSGGFTNLMMRNASNALASLIYTAWVQAGSPRMYPNAVAEPIDPDRPRLISVSPNPVTESAVIRFLVPENNMKVEIGVYGSSGKLDDTVISESMSEGYHDVRWTPKNLGSGTYFCVLKSGSHTTTRKFILVR
jgi:hypothetical protein